MCHAIATLAVRGAPALGAAGAFGVALAAQIDGDPRAVRGEAGRIVNTRPTAVNLRWGVERALKAFEYGAADSCLATAVQICIDDVAANRSIGRYGADLIPVRAGGAQVLTHCNAGHLATVGFGTALGVVRVAHERGNVANVWIDETRPLLQGARLTAWECGQLGIPATVIVDSAAGVLMSAGKVDAVVVGADRIAANGDVANKIGTFSIAVLAHYHQIPFLVAAPVSTVDAATRTGADIEIEDRDETELAEFNGRQIVGAGVSLHNPAFDVTPAELITAIVTDLGAVTPQRLYEILI